MSHLRKRLAKMLEEAMLETTGRVITMNPKDFVIAQGFYRTDSRSDSYRWEAYAFEGRVRICFSSYSTMTAIVKSGAAKVVRDTRMASSFDVYDATGN